MTRKRATINRNQELKRLLKQRKDWMKNPSLFIDFNNPLCRLGWADSYWEELEILDEAKIGSNRS